MIAVVCCAFRRILFLLLLLVAFNAEAAQVDTADVFSLSMKKNIRVVVILPQGYIKNNHYPVVYLLHGHGGNHTDWITKVPEVKDLADVYQMIIICPDGNNSWYFDSPEDSTYRYETFVACELTSWTDKHFSTVANRSGRAITGLSMGGHGALYLSFRHQDIFGAAGSMSGGVDLRPFPNNWDIALRLGSLKKYPERWDKNSVVNMLYMVPPGSLNILFDCGASDFFYAANLHLHEEMLYRGIPHDFIVRPGGHDWNYWSNALPYQLQFMHRFFVRTKASVK